MAPPLSLGVISGGSGSSKFVTALDKFAESSIEIQFVVNVGDNFWHHGLYVCPDIDILTYALAQKLDVERGWGLLGDFRKFNAAYGGLRRRDEWFSLGDADLALSALRTELLAKGWTLSEVTEFIRQSLGVRQQIIPSTDDSLETFLQTPLGKVHLQEFWVKNRGALRVTGVEYAGEATPNRRILKALSERTLILPANPITSIMPTLMLPNVRKTLAKSKVIAISPFVGSKVFSGPAPQLMKSLGNQPTSFGVAELYSDFLKIFLVDNFEEPSILRQISDLGVECVKTNIMIREIKDKQSIVEEIVRLL